MKTNPFIAHTRVYDGATKTLENHLREVSRLAKQLAAKINAPEAGELMWPE